MITLTWNDEVKLNAYVFSDPIPITSPYMCNIYRDFRETEDDQQCIITFAQGWLTANNIKHGVTYESLSNIIIQFHSGEDFVYTKLAWAGIGLERLYEDAIRI